MRELISMINIINNVSMKYEYKSFDNIHYIKNIDMSIFPKPILEMIDYTIEDNKLMFKVKKEYARDYRILMKNLIKDYRYILEEKYAEFYSDLNKILTKHNISIDYTSSDASDWSGIHDFNIVGRLGEDCDTYIIIK